MGGTNGSFIGYGIFIPASLLKAHANRIGDGYEYYEFLEDNYIVDERYKRKEDEYETDGVMFYPDAYLSSVCSRTGTYTDPELSLIDLVAPVDASFLKQPDPQWDTYLIEKLRSLYDMVGMEMEEQQVGYYIGFIAGS